MCVFSPHEHHCAEACANKRLFASQGTLDLMIQRTGEQGEGAINFINNGLFFDAFFLKAIGEFGCRKLLGCATS